MEKFDGFIFDVDGTLAATNELIFASFNHVAEKYVNRKLSNEEIIALFGPTEDIILKDWMKDRYTEARKDYFDFYLSKHEEMAEIYPGIKDILRFIKEQDKPLAIFTGKGRESAEITLREIGVIDFFDLIVSGDDIPNHKPAPDGIFKILEEFSLDPSKTLMIGDAPSDIYASRDAGVKVASVVWDSYAKEEVLSLEKDYLFNTVDELSNFIKSAT